MKQAIKVVMLPTKDKTQLFDSRRDDKLHYHFKGHTPNNVKSYQHLYITVSQGIEPIKEGETYIRDDGKLIIRKNTLSVKGSKIIGTTDLNLGIKDEFGKWYLIPQLQQLFLKEYIVNLKKNWEVEYYSSIIEYNNMIMVNHNEDKSYFSAIDVEVEFSEHYDYLISKGAKYYTKKLKLNSNNILNITSVQKKMYSKEEVESLLYKYADEEHAQFSSKFFIETFNNWIKENL